MTTTLHLYGPTRFVDLIHGFSHLLPSPATTLRNLKNVALFIAAPFIGLVYALTLPVAGLAMLAWIGGKALVGALAARHVLARARDFAMFIAAPLIGLAYAVLLPLVGLALIAWIGFKAYGAPEAAA